MIEPEFNLNSYSGCAVMQAIPADNITGKPNRFVRAHNLRFSVENTEKPKLTLEKSAPNGEKPEEPKKKSPNVMLAILIYLAFAIAVIAAIVVPAIIESKNSPSPEDFSIGDVVTFGNYKWMVIDNSQENVLKLFCIESVAEKPYNNDLIDVTWETCTLRKWLNEDFYNEFTDEDKALIVDTNVINDGNEKYETEGGNDTLDKVFLLSYDEVFYYLNDDNSSDLGNYWWLRSPGIDQGHAEYGFFDDSLYVNVAGQFVYEEHSVYPCINVSSTGGGISPIS